MLQLQAGPKSVYEWTWPLPRAEKAVAEAWELDPSLAEALAARGGTATEGAQIELGKRPPRRAIDAHPDGYKTTGQKMARDGAEASFRSRTSMLSDRSSTLSSFSLDEHAHDGLIEGDV